MAHNRLLNFHVVRSTRPVQFTPTAFVPDKDQRTLRNSDHLVKNPEFPDPKYHLDSTQKYFFRHEKLRHLRVEQLNRYFSMTGGESNEDNNPCVEDTLEDEEDAIPPETYHRHYDDFAENTPPGSTYPSMMKHINGARRRKQARLGVSRIPFIEPIGEKREKFYEQKLLCGLAWYCADKPIVDADGDTVWTFRWDPPEDVGDALLKDEVLVVSSSRALSFEQTCSYLEGEFCRHEHGLVCACCLKEMETFCKACRFAVGFHRCQNPKRKSNHLVWRKGSLHASNLDVQRVLYNLHRKGLPTKTLREKAKEYVDAGLISEDMAEQICRVIEADRKF